MIDQHHASLRGPVLVTGGTGFIGGRPIERLVLEMKCRVRVLVRNFASAARIATLPVGYEAAFTLQSGMRLTEDWARWANLL